MDASILVAEEALLIAVRDTLRKPTASGGAGLAEQECEVEFDEHFPAIAGDTYCAVIPGGWRPGPRHNTSGGVNDLVYAVDVAVVKRVTAIARDRRRDIFAGNLSSLNAVIGRVYEAIDFSYLGILAAANQIIEERSGSTEPFVEPLRFAGIERRPRTATAEMFAAQGTTAGMIRTISFGGARRITVKT